MQILNFKPENKFKIKKGTHLNTIVKIIYWINKWNGKLVFGIFILLLNYAYFNFCEKNIKLFFRYAALYDIFALSSSVLLGLIFLRYFIKLKIIFNLMFIDFCKLNSATLFGEMYDAYNDILVDISRKKIPGKFLKYEYVIKRIKF